MASTSRRSPSSSLFFRDLASSSPSAPRSRLPSSSSTPSHFSHLPTASPSTNALPPPPAFTLDDRSDFSPDAPPGELPSPPSPIPFRTPPRSNSKPRAPTEDPSPSSGTPHTPTPVANWWSPVRDEKGKGSPVDGVVEPGALVVLPPPREVVRPEVKERTVDRRGLDEEEWVTVYGFSPADTNLVLREFEKCGPILQHVLGPRDANWMHILYQSRYDAQKALQKNGVQLNSVLIVGVKPVDPMQRQFLNEKLNANRGFMVSLPPPLPLVNGKISTAATTSKSSRYLLHANGDGNIGDAGRRSEGAIATPSKSVFSKAVDLMFGL